MMQQRPTLSILVAAAAVAVATAGTGSVGQRSLQDYDYVLYYDDDDDVAAADAAEPYDDDYNDDGFVGYVEQSRDPGAAFLIVTILLSFASLAALPCLVVWGDKYERRRKRAKLERKARRKEKRGGSGDEGGPGRRKARLGFLRFFKSWKSAQPGEDDRDDRADGDGGLHDLHLKGADTDDTAEMMEVSPTNLGCEEPRKSTNPFDDPPPPPTKDNRHGKNKTKKKQDSSTFRYEMEAGPNAPSAEGPTRKYKHPTVHTRQCSKDSLDDLVGRIDNTTDTGTGTGTLSDDRSLSSGIQRAIDTIVIPPYPQRHQHLRQRRGKKSKQPQGNLDDCNRSVVSAYSHDPSVSSRFSAGAQSINSFVELTLNAVPRNAGHRGRARHRAPPAQRARKLRKDIEQETRLSAMNRANLHHHQRSMQHQAGSGVGEREDEERGQMVQSHESDGGGDGRSQREVPQAAVPSATNNGPSNKQQQGGNTMWGWLHNLGSPNRHHVEENGHGQGGDVTERTQIWHHSRSNANTNSLPPPPPPGKTGNADMGNILLNPLSGVIGNDNDKDQNDRRSSSRGGSIPPPPSRRRQAPAPPGGGSGNSQQGPPPPPSRRLSRASTGGENRLRRSASGGGDQGGGVPSAVIVPPISTEDAGAASSSDIVARALSRNAAAWEVMARARAKSASPAFNLPGVAPTNAGSISPNSEVPDQLKPQLAPPELIVASATAPADVDVPRHRTRRHRSPPPPPPVESNVPASITLPVHDGDLLDDDDGDISKLSQARYLSPDGGGGGGGAGVNHFGDYPEDDDEMELDVCCGPNPIFSRKYLHRGFDNLIELLDTDRESKRIIRLAIPMTTSEILETVFAAIQVSLVAKHLGTDSVAAMAMAQVFVGMTEEFLRGIIDAQVSITSHAIGVGNNYLAGQYVQLSAVLYTLASVPEFVVWWWAIAPATMWLGLNARVAQIAQQYARVLLFAEWLDAMSECLHGIYEVTDHEVFSTIITLVEGCITVAMTAVAVTSVPGIELYQVAIFDIGIGVVFLIVNFWYPWRKGWLRPFIPGMFHSLAFRNRNALWNMVRTSAPLAFGQLLAYGEWEALTIFCAHLGPAEVATWALMGYIWETFEASTEGIGDASEIRVSYHLGKGNPQMAKIASYKCITMAMIFATFVTSIFFIIGDDLPRLMTNDPTIQHLMSELTPLVGVGNLTMTFGMVSWALIGAQGRYSLATKVATFSSWFVTIPLASIFVYGFRFDLQGVTCAVVLGYSFCGMILAYILLRSNWSKLSLIVQEINAVTGEVDSSDEESSDDDSSDSSDSSVSSSSGDDSSASSSSSDSSLSLTAAQSRSGGMGSDMRSSILGSKSTSLTSSHMNR